ncbi:Predicted chitinase [Chryseobacterium nakagawai]|uniref:Chitinase n=1 Tax=Chryseobacterium nakagawai TaxID=1241982 RepID=A0AAD1DSN5_CHRNA|nr:hypothetical protein [Chryseobacterium nakagawai]AZA93108.1 hypothetical protein EG343_22130 [Chryseobacterium nakagawai]VEH19751.1 Predicted chitinase [Chryseobacterium nakagawai]
MAKKGVLRISGNTSPKTGEKTFYKVTEWYPDTPANEKNEALVTWELFRKRPDGQFTTTSIKKKVGEFTFGKDSWQETFRVEGYLNSPEGKEPMSIIVQPQKNEQPPSTEKNILEVKLTFQDGTAVNKKLSYKDRLTATAKCQGLEGEHIILTLWEDDENGDGHNNKNQSIVKSPPVLVDSQGNARWNFTLLNTYIALANQREDDKKQHEYYVTAEYNGKLKASDNATADNPEYKAPPAPSRQPNAPKPQPNPNSPKGSTRPNSPNNQPDKKGVITQVKLTDKNGKEFGKNPKYGETIIVHIESKNLVGKKYILKIWEHDLIGDNDLLYSHEHTFLADKINLSMPLTPAMQKTGEVGNNPKNPDSGEYWKGGQQEIFAEVIFLNLSSKSQTIDVDIIEAPKPQNNGTTPSGVQNQPKADPKNCGGKFCIDKNAPPSELIREINIRLSGFGGNVPTDKFTDRSEKMVKQFQKDYMKVPETGKVCGNVLRAIDEFSKNFDISTTFWNQMKCDCSTKGKKATSVLRGIQETNSCDGFGDGTGKGTYKSTSKTEAYHKYEYPGIHRSLLFGFKALQFYFSKQTTYKIDHFTSGYRCRFKNYSTTNHQGKAIDMQFSKGTWAIRGENKKNLVELRNMRDTLFVKYLGAQKEWPNTNLFSIEPIDLLYNSKGKVRFDHTFSWIHMDVRQFDAQYLEDKYFCKSLTALNGKSIVQLAIEAGYANTCSCYSSYQSQAAAPQAAGSCACNKDITKEQLKGIATGASQANIDKYFDGFNQTFKKFNINSCLQKIHFLAQINKESEGFKYNVELGDAAYLAPYKGWHGRGLIQLTGKENYEAFQAAIGEDVTSSAEARDKVAKSPYATYSAGWFWDKRAVLNSHADNNDFIYICYCVNGGFNHIDDRLESVKNGFESLYSKCTTSKGKTTDYKFKDSKAYDNKKAAFAWGLWHDPQFDKKGCKKDKQLAIEGYQRVVDLTKDTDTTTNYYGIQGLSYFSDLVTTKIVDKKTKKFVNVRKAALKRLNDLKK